MDSNRPPNELRSSRSSNPCSQHSPKHRHDDQSDGGTKQTETGYYSRHSQHDTSSRTASLDSARTSGNKEHNPRESRRHNEFQQYEPNGGKKYCEKKGKEYDSKERSKELPRSTRDETYSSTQLTDNDESREGRPRADENYRDNNKYSHEDAFKAKSTDSPRSRRGEEYSQGELRNSDESRECRQGVEEKHHAKRKFSSEHGSGERSRESPRDTRHDESNTGDSWHSDKSNGDRPREEGHCRDQRVNEQSLWSHQTSSRSSRSLCDDLDHNTGIPHNSSDSTREYGKGNRPSCKENHSPQVSQERNDDYDNDSLTGGKRREEDKQHFHFLPNQTESGNVNMEMDPDRKKIDHDGSSLVESTRKKSSPYTKDGSDDENSSKETACSNRPEDLTAGEMQQDKNKRKSNQEQLDNKYKVSSAKEIRKKTELSFESEGTERGIEVSC